VDVKRASDLYGQGQTLRQIGAELGLTTTTVSQQLKSAGVTMRRGGHRSQGCRLPERR
jgi:DNA-binding CsgD family transcriptional regulator